MIKHVWILRVNIKLFHHNYSLKIKRSFLYLTYLSNGCQPRENILKITHFSYYSTILSLEKGIKNKICILTTTVHFPLTSHQKWNRFPHIIWRKIQPKVSKLPSTCCEISISVWMVTIFDRHALINFKWKRTLMARPC